MKRRNYYYEEGVSKRDVQDFQFMIRGIVEDASGKHRSLIDLAKNGKKYLLTRSEIKRIETIIELLDELNGIVPFMMERIVADYEGRDEDDKNYKSWMQRFAPRV